MDEHRELWWDSPTVELVVVVAALLRTTPLQIGWNWLQRRGISSDQLYPAADVYLGADILNHLVKPVEGAVPLLESLIWPHRSSATNFSN